MKNWTRKEVLDVIAVTYTADTRSITNIGACNYIVNGKKCAIGLLIPDDLYDPVWDEKMLSVDDIWECLPSNIQSLGLDFLMNCQYLHDNDWYWDADGLSEQGQQEIKRLYKKYVDL